MSYTCIIFFSPERESSIVKFAKGENMPESIECMLGWVGFILSDFVLIGSLEVDLEFLV